MGIPHELLNSNAKFPSPPGIVLRLLESIRKDDFSFTEIAGIIKSDPALTTRELTMVNSSFYSLPAKVSNIERALAIMGVNAVKNISLSFMLVSTLKSDKEGSFDFSYFWRRTRTARILITGQGDMETVTDAINKGAIFKFISKPLSCNFLRDTVDEAVRHWEMSRNCE